jgi:hypothetical protein
MSDTMNRTTWTDERLDDLSRRMDTGLDRVDADIRELRGDMNFRFDRLETRFDSMRRLMFGMLATIVAAFLVSIFGFLITNA